jgi:hypothetical protein
VSKKRGLNVDLQAGNAPKLHGSSRAVDWDKGLSPMIVLYFMVSPSQNFPQPFALTIRVRDAAQHSRVAILEFKTSDGLHEKRCDNAMLCNRKVNKEKHRCPLCFLSGAGQSAQPRAGASYSTKAGNSDTGNLLTVYRGKSG